jgi:hypothetical protein
VFQVYIPVYRVFLAFVTEIDLNVVQRDAHIVSFLSLLGQLNETGSVTDLLYAVCISVL